MTYLPKIATYAADTASIDAFDRWRTSEPETLFDSKLIFDDGGLFWDDVQESGSGTASAHDSDNAHVTISVGATTAGKRTRQTYRHFNYQPGKSQLILMTFLSGASSSGNTKLIGYGNDDNGLFLKLDDGSVAFTRRTNVTGTPADNDVAQASWNIDPLDGTGASGITLDFTKTQILVIDFEWLGVGRVRMGFVVDGIIYYAHQFLNANSLTTVYMSMPNLPLRYQIENDGTGAADSIDCICSSVISEGGQQDTGVSFSANNKATHVDAASNGTGYAILGIRQKTTHLGLSVILKSMSCLSETGDDYLIEAQLNPTVAGTFTYSSVNSNSGVEYATGATANTVTDGEVLFSMYGGANTAMSSEMESRLLLGSAVDGTRDEIVLVATPLSANLDILATLNWRELQ